MIEYGARIYDRVRIGMKSYISGFICNDVVIGDNCVVAGSLIHAHLKSGLESAPTIEDNCLIGTGSIIVGGITISKGTVIAAGAVVRSDTEEGYVYVGAPARRGRKVQWH